MSHIQVRPRTSQSLHHSVTLQLSPVPLPPNLVTISRLPLTTGSADPAPPPPRWTTAFLLLLTPLLRIPVATLLQLGGTAVDPLQPSMPWTFTLLTTMLPLPLQLCLRQGRAACKPLPAVTQMPSATRLYRTGTTARLRPQSACLLETAVFLRIV